MVSFDSYPVSMFRTFKSSILQYWYGKVYSCKKNRRAAKTYLCCVQRSSITSRNATTE